MGDPCDVLIARHEPDGRLAGIACRAEHRAFVNGHEASLGYIGQIRVSEGFRGHWLVQRGAPLFRDAGPRDLLYFGVIAGENARARELLVGARPPGGLHAVRVCGLTTCAILLRPRRAYHAHGVDVRSCSSATLPAVVSFLRAVRSATAVLPGVHARGLLRRPDAARASARRRDGRLAKR